jgi:ribosomal protein S18 acetylase RimI-like enzyme
MMTREPSARVARVGTLDDVNGELFARYVPGVARRPLPAPAVVRRAREDDLDACARLAAARNGGDTAAWTSRLHGQLADPHGALLVAEVDDVVGYARVTWFGAPQGAPANAAPAGYYLMGVLVDPGWRRRGLGERLTVARLAWVWERAAECWFFANARNRASLDLHARLGFQEVTRDFWFPDVSFAGGEGVLGCAERPEL